MQHLNKATLILATVTFVLAGWLINLFQQSSALKKTLANNQLSCTQQMSALKADYQEQLGILKDYLLAQYGAKQESHKNIQEAEELEEDELVKAKPKLATYSETLNELVARKYRFLFSNLNLSESEKIKLQQLLMERERIALRIQDAKKYPEVARDVSLGSLEYELADIDQQIQALLDQENYQKYDLLKESDEEQEDFTQYTLGINGLFPLSHDQQEAVLFTKLHHKQKFEDTIKQSGLYNDYPLNDEQRNRLYIALEDAVNEYKDSFLKEIKPRLGHDNFPFDQYTLLENYETTEFNDLLKELKAKIDKRAQ